jgi:hypothetical protein
MTEKVSTSFKRAAGLCQPALETQRTDGFLSAIPFVEKPNFTKIVT